MREITEEMARGYLLGELRPEDEFEFEQQYFRDDVLFESLQVIQDELIRDFLIGDLNSRERDLFRRRYVASSALRERMRMANILLGVLVSDSEGTAQPAASSLDLRKARDEDESAVVEAVTSVLLPSLPSALRVPVVHPKALFLAIDSVAMLICRRIREIQPPIGRLVLDADCSILLDNHVLVSAGVVVGEIASAAKVSDGVALILAKWIRTAATLCPRLMSGIDSWADGDSGGVRLVMTERHPDEDPGVRWASGRAKPYAPFASEDLAVAR